MEGPARPGAAEIPRTAPAVAPSPPLSPASPRWPSCLQATTGGQSKFERAGAEQAELPKRGKTKPRQSYLFAPHKISFGHHQRLLFSPCTLVVTAQMPHEGSPWRATTKCSFHPAHHHLMAESFMLEKTPEITKSNQESDAEIRISQPRSSAKDTREAHSFR